MGGGGEGGSGIKIRTCLIEYEGYEERKRAVNNIDLEKRHSKNSVEARFMRPPRVKMCP